jgi:hypothetical protein
MTKENTKNSSESTIEIIEDNAIVNIKISTSFFQRLQMVYLSLIKDKKPEDIQKFLEEVKTEKISSEENYNVETLLILLSEFQKNAKAEGFTRIVTQDELQKINQERFAQQEKDQK